MLILSLLTKNKRKERNYNILQKKWHNVFEKTCRCKSCYAYKRGRNELSVKRCIGNITCKKNSKISEIFGAKDPLKKDVYASKAIFARPCPFGC
jgi:hypothetical protein